MNKVSESHSLILGGHRYRMFIINSYPHQDDRLNWLDKIKSLDRLEITVKGIVGRF